MKIKDIIFGSEEENGKQAFKHFLWSYHNKLDNENVKFNTVNDYVDGFIIFCEENHHIPREQLFPMRSDLHEEIKINFYKYNKNKIGIKSNEIKLTGDKRIDEYMSLISEHGKLSEQISFILDNPNKKGEIDNEAFTTLSKKQEIVWGKIQKNYEERMKNYKKNELKEEKRKKKIATMDWTELPLQRATIEGGSWLGGVCKGLSRKYAWDLNTVRLVFGISYFTVIGIFVYLGMWIWLPKEKTEY